MMPSYTWFSMALVIIMDFCCCSEFVDHFRSNLAFFFTLIYLSNNNNNILKKPQNITCITSLNK